MTQTHEYPKVVQEIHREFMTAGDKLLAEATAILTGKQVEDADKAQRLADIGFTNTKQVKDFKQHQKQIHKSREHAELIQHYARVYPLYKFITDEMVAEICKKYKLECGPIHVYRGFVPAKNLKEIENFTVSESDKRESLIRPIDFSFPGADSGKIARFYRENPTGWAKGYTRYREDFVRLKDGTTIEVQKFQKADNSKLMICAPKKDMNMKGLSKLGVMFLSVVTIEKPIPDPVVLQPVKGGHLIVTAWGDEASDPIVVNQKMN